MIIRRYKYKWNNMVIIRKYWCSNYGINNDNNNSNNIDYLMINNTLKCGYCDKDVIY